MRPIHGLLALAAIAFILIGGLLFWTNSDPAAPTDVDGGRRDVAGSTERPPLEDLAAVPKDDRDRTAQAGTEGVAPGRAESPTGDGKAQRVSGRVLDEGGKPIANAIVYAAAGGGMDEIALDEFDPAETFWIQRSETKTDSSGRFALDPKINAKVRLAVRAGGFAPLDVERTISETRPDVGDLVVQAGVVVEWPTPSPARGRRTPPPTSSRQFGHSAPPWPAATCRASHSCRTSPLPPSDGKSLDAELGQNRPGELPQ